MSSCWPVVALSNYGKFLAPPSILAGESTLQACCCWYHPDFGKYPMQGEGKCVLAVTNPANGQKWWIERHEVV